MYHCGGLIMTLMDPLISGVARVSGAQGNAENWRPPEADMRTKKKHLMIPSI